MVIFSKARFLHFNSACSSKVVRLCLTFFLVLKYSLFFEEVKVDVGSLKSVELAKVRALYQSLKCYLFMKSQCIEIASIYLYTFFFCLEGYSRDSGEAVRNVYLLSIAIAYASSFTHTPFLSKSLQFQVGILILVKKMVINIG